MSIRFCRFSKQSYWEANRAIPGVEDDIVVENGCRGGGMLWEFSIRQHDLGSGRSAVRVEMFADSVVALRSDKVVKALIALKGCATLDDAEKRLLDAGIRVVKRK